MVRRLLKVHTEVAMSVVGLSFGSPTSGEGFDVSATVSSIVANLENVETPWKTQLTTLESQDTVLSSLGTLLSTLSTDMTNLTESTGVLSEKEGSSSNDTVLELTAASTSAVAGTHTVLVTDLAKTSSGYLTEVTDSSDTLSGSISIQVGSGTAQTITLTSSDDTLSGLASAINSAGIGVTASVLTDSTGSRLSLVSGTSGTDGELTVSSSITDTSNSDAALDYTSAVTGSNGTITVDGVELSISSNIVSDLIPGVTFDLLSTSSTAVQVVIANYDTGVESSISTLVSDYNALVSALDAQDGDDSAGNAEPLYGSPTLTMLQQDILGGINAANPSGYLDAISTSTGTTLSGSITITVGSGTAQTIDVPTTSGDNTISGLADAINSADIGVTAAVTTSSGKSTLTLTSQTTGSSGALVVTSAITATSDTALSATVTSGSSTVTSSATLTGISDESDTLSGSISIKVGSSGTAQTITIGTSSNTLSTLADAINTADIGVTASVVTNTDGTYSLSLESGTSGTAGTLTVTSSILDTSDTSTATLDYTSSSDINSLSALGISVNTDGTLSLDETTLVSALDSDYSSVAGFFQNANSWGANFTKTLTNAGDSSSTGILKMAEKSNSSTESTLNADISREEILISAQESSLTLELTSANEIMQMIPMQISEVNELYSAITGYNQSS
jgi:flagellar hook-associated protein 2